MDTRAIQPRKRGFLRRSVRLLIFVVLPIAVIVAGASAFRSVAQMRTGQFVHADEKAVDQSNSNVPVPVKVALAKTAAWKQSPAPAPAIKAPKSPLQVPLKAQRNQMRWMVDKTSGRSVPVAAPLQQSVGKAKFTPPVNSFGKPAPSTLRPHSSQMAFGQSNSLAKGTAVHSGATDKILSLVKEESEKTKVKQEIERPLWQSAYAKQLLSRIERPVSKVTLRYAKLTTDDAEKLVPVDSPSLNDVTDSGWKLQHATIDTIEFEAILKEIESGDSAKFSNPASGVLRPVASADTLGTRNGFIAPQNPSHASSHGVNKVRVAATEKLIAGASAVSFLSPKHIQPTYQPNAGDVALRFDSVDIKLDEIAVSGTLTLRVVTEIEEQLLPVKIGSDNLTIQTPKLTSHSAPCSMSLKKDSVELISACLDSETDQRIIVAISTSINKPTFDDAKGLTLKDLRSLEKLLPPLPRSTTLQTVATQKTNPIATVPLKLQLQFGDTESESAHATTIGLSNNDSSLSIMGVVDSQQITRELVQVSGQKIRFENNADNSFVATADQGSVSYRRRLPIENSLTLDLQQNASLTWAGLRFTADTIRCESGRIFASGDARLEIPGVSTTIKAQQLTLNLASFQIDSRGRASIDRRMEAKSMPVAINSEYLGLDLATGQISTASTNRPIAVRPISSNRQVQLPPFQPIKSGRPRRSSPSNSNLGPFKSSPLTSEFPVRTK